MCEMIKSFVHKGLEAFYRSESKAGICPEHASRLKRQLSRLDEARSACDMNLPGWKLHELKGHLALHYEIAVSGNWRMTFRFDRNDVVLVDYQDYH